MKFSDCFKLILLVVLAIFVASCEENRQGVKLVPKSSAIFEGVQLHSDLGIKHNEIVNDWFQSNKHNLQYGIDSRMKLVDDYFMDKYATNTSEIKFRLFAIEANPNSRISDFSLEFNPYDYLNNQKEHIQPETYNILLELFVNTERLETTQEEFDFLQALDSRIIDNDLLSRDDKNGLRNLIIVYKASAKYWSTNLDDWNNALQNANGRCPRSSYQKIVWADIIEGTAGGLLGGPAGALIGLAAGSLTMAVGECI